MKCYEIPIRSLSIQIMFKMDWNGMGQEIMLSELSSTIFKDLSFEQFASTCVMAGCDFLPNIPNIGIKKALKQIQISGDYEKVRMVS